MHCLTHTWVGIQVITHDVDSLAKYPNNMIHIQAIKITQLFQDCS